MLHGVLPVSVDCTLYFFVGVGIFVLGGFAVAKPSTRVFSFITEVATSFPVADVWSTDT